ncbi:MAG: EamA family transporter [Bacteroidota bacterium]
MLSSRQGTGTKFIFSLLLPQIIPAMSRITKAHLSMLGVSVIFGLHYSIAKSMMPAYLTPTAVSYYTYLQPLLAAVSSVSVGMERITLPKMAAALLIFMGVYLVTSRKEDPGWLKKMPER